MSFIITPLVIDPNQIIHFLTIVGMFSIPCLMLWFDNRRYSRKMDQLEQSELNQGNPNHAKRCKDCPFLPKGELIPAVSTHGQEGDTGSSTPGNSR